jgi:hypothetical protein
MVCFNPSVDPLQVTRDVLELRIDEKIRVLYARSKNAVLIIEIVWNHKLDKPIKRVRQYPLPVSY